ncbi:bacterial group 2 Ig-like protein [Clostridium sp. CAG:964]|nr:bacterial group 2 Ig-like protein [Clostridium sp. CAG:964]
MGKLNKLTSILLSAIMIIGIFGVVPFAASAAVSGSYEYSVKSDSTAKITRYIDNGSKTVTIPSTIGGYVSTEIGQRAFENRSSFNAVTIPSSITSIGEFAFRGCTGLASVSIPNTVEKIGNCAFGYTYGSGHYVKIDGFTIYGTKGTAAERYAYSNGLNFVERAAAPAEVRLSRSSLALSVGEAYTLKSTVLPNDAKNKTCKWYTSRSSVAAVSSTGRVTARAVGTAVITAKTVNGKKATCKVTVSPVPTGVKISPTALTLGKGESYTLKGTVLPNDAKNKTCKWYTSRSSVAAVSSTGSTGTASVRITLYNGRTATCKVTVKAMPTSVKISPTALTLGKGESYTIKENTNSGSYANAANLKWTSTNTRVVTVKKGSGNKAALKAVGTGTASVRVTLYNGRTATCRVTIKKAPASVKISPSSLTLNVGESYTIKENTNSGSYANAANLKWTSTNTRVVTVKKGSGNRAVLKAVSEGTANVKLTLYNGKTAICKVSVVDCSDVYSAKTDKDYYSLSHKVYEIVNQERIKAGVKPLRFNDKVYKAAMIRAKECHKYFSHIRPNGKDCFTALSEAGVKQNYAGENIAVGFSSPKSVMEVWMQSSGHRSNILNPVFTDFGCGVCNTGEWTQFFCKVV